MSIQLINKIFITHFITYKTLFLVLVLLFVAYNGCRFIPQTTHRGSMSKYYRSMEKGNSKSAVYWAKYILYHAPEDYSSYVDLAHAYELDGQYEKAMEFYVDAQNRAKPFSYHDTRYGYPDTPRVKYKLNRKREAFLGYCQYADHCLLGYQKQLKNERWNDRNMALGSIRYPITMEQSSTFMRLSPFLEYKDFLDFMEEEYQKLGEPPEYAAAMELFRSIDTEIYEANLPRRSGAAYAMREQILAERKAKGVKW